LAVTFAVAGITKSRDHAGATATAAAFGIPAYLASPVATLVSVLELAVALGLLFNGTAIIAAGVAVGLLVAFMAGLTSQLARGITVPCACFGTLSSTPVSWRTVARNAALAALAIYVMMAA
jgi:hypothetical protein